jgi:hypothetical protein
VWKGELKRTLGILTESRPHDKTSQASTSHDIVIGQFERGRVAMDTSARHKAGEDSGDEDCCDMLSQRTHLENVRVVQVDIEIVDEA